MRALAIVTGVILSCAGQARADCGFNATLLSRSVAEGTPQLVVEVDLFARTPSFELVAADGTRYAATIVTRYPGNNLSAQYVIEPASPLTRGAYKVLAKGFVYPISLDFEVTAKPTKPAIAWRSDPKLGAQSQIEFGCGPAKSIEVEIDAADATVAFIELADTVKQTTERGFVQIRAGKLSIGHGMCGGQFPLVRGRSYVAAIALSSSDHAGTSSVKTIAIQYNPR